MPIVNFVSRHAAERFVPGTGGFRHLISISDPDVTPRLQPGWASVLPLRFHDNLGPVEHPRYRYPQACYSTRGDCERVIGYASPLLAQGENVLVHCEAGVSRSGAVALALEAIGFELLNRSRANAANAYMLGLFGEILGVAVQTPAGEYGPGGLLIGLGD